MKRRVTVEIDLKAIVRNYRKIAAFVRPAKVLCVLKANAYGLGCSAYAKAIADAGCTMFGVAESFEAIELQKALTGYARKEGGNKAIEIQILSSVLPDEISEMVRRGVILPVTDLKTARLISDAAVKAKVIAKVHVKLDTGMGRLGILAKDAINELRKMKSLPNLDFEGIFSHFPVAYDPKDSFTKKQIVLFKRIVAAAEKEGFHFKKVHIAASDGINNFPEVAKKPFNVVRTGINLHGSFDPNGRKALKVEPVLTLKTRVAQVRELPPGTTLGYGRTWCLDAPTKVATISAGYADGLPLALANRGFVFIGGRRCKILGRISMDYATVDVSEVSNVKEGDEVICFGSSGNDSITPDDWAALKGTHAYDIICSLGSRVKRVVLASLLALCFVGCFSIDHATMMRPNEEHLLVSNYGWYLFNLIPLACGNASPDGYLPSVIFRDDVTMDKVQARFMDKAKDLGKTQTRDLVYITYDSILFEVPGLSVPIPIPYVLTYREIQLSGIVYDYEAKEEVNVK